MGTNGQLGHGDEEDAWEPVEMKGKQLETRSVASASGGGQHTVLLAKDNGRWIYIFLLYIHMYKFHQY